MDLIYSTSEHKDIGVLQDYTLDLAYGSDENSMELTIDMQNHCCSNGYYIYIDGTEYGGIIDSIKVDSEAERIKYIGRTWHGILAGKILQPAAGYDYLVLSGEANSVINKVIQIASLTSLFKASTVNSGINIYNYTVPRYIDAYTALKEMLYTYTGKLKLEVKNGIVELSAIPYIDYSQDEEWDSSQLDFTIEKHYRPTNHLICMGQGNLRDRYIIHLFTDENGGIKPYATSSTPVKDSDYIRDTSKQVLFGVDEVTEVYDYPSADITDNYVALQTIPNRWPYIYTDYYVRNENAGFDKLEREYVEVYSQQSSAPGDWQTRYGSYYEKNGNNYDSVTAVATELYILQNSKPNEWEDGYGDFYYYYSDGTTSNYKKVTGESGKDYVIQTSKPTDWEDNFSSYKYKNKKTSGYSSVNGITEKKYTRLSEKPDNWNKEYKNYFVRKSDGVSRYYEAVKSDTKDVYTIQTIKPTGWKENASNYYYKKSGKYFKLDVPTTIKYTLQKEKPIDWSSKYKSYYYKYSTGNGYDYRTVPSVVKYKYTLQTTKPDNWETNYKSYYYYYTSGSDYSYVKVPSVTSYEYVLQTSKPTDWDTKYKSYYYIKDGKYVHVTGDTAPTWTENTYYTKESVEKAPTWKKNTYYTKESVEKAPVWETKKYYTKDVYSNPPTWEANKYYTHTTKEIAPEFVDNKYYSMEETVTAPAWKAKKYYTEYSFSYAPEWISGKYFTKTISLTAPTWTANKYYAKETKENIPAWSSDKYYELCHDHYAVLVENGLERLKDTINGDKLKIDLDANESYDIGDVVGARENITGISTWQRITKKIVGISNNEVTITYKVGD